MAGKKKPERPQSVPPDAHWVAKDNAWELGAGKARTRHGPFRYWRADGTLMMECVLQAGVPHGPYRRFHENGELSQEGLFVEGAYHGKRTFHGSDQPTTEPRAEASLAPQVWKSELDCELGQVVAVRHFDRAGNRINSDGSPVPPRPKGVAEKAEYRFEDQTWVDVGLDKEGKRHGRLKRWNGAGRLVEETDWEHGLRHGASRAFGPDGKVREEGRFRRGERTGVFRFYSEDGRVEAEREFHGGALTGHAEEYDDAGQLELEETYVRGQRDGVFRLKTTFWNPAVAEVQGSWRKGVPESPWTLMGHDGVPLELLEMGTSDGALGSAPVFTDTAQPGEVWRTQGKAFEDSGQRNLALVAWARAASAEAQVQPLWSALARLAIPVTGARGARILTEAVRQGDAAALLTGLRIGATAPRVLEQLALRLDRASRSRAALDLINAAILLTPEEADLWFTRAQVLMSLGLADAAEREAHALASADPERSELLLDLGRVLFCDFGFWPGQVPLEGESSGALARSMEEITEVLEVLATRLHRTRAELLERVKDGAKWLPPNLESLLPEGPVKLKAHKARGKTPAVDQTRGLAKSPEVPALMRSARNDWAALTWLCWAVGLDAVKRPEALAPRAQLGAAAVWNDKRLSRCRERLEGKGAPAGRVEWEGMELESMHPGLLAVAEAEWAGVHAVMSWLVDAGAPGLWHETPRAKG